MALAIGAIFPSTDSITDARVACELWSAVSKAEFFDVESENTVRLLILLALFSLLQDGFGSSWHLVELAVRTSITLGMHRHTAKGTPDANRSTIFWSVIVLDRWTSAVLGLPVSIRSDEIDLPEPQLVPTGAHEPLSTSTLWYSAYNNSAPGDWVGSLPNLGWLGEEQSLQSTILNDHRLLSTIIFLELRVARMAHGIDSPNLVHPALAVDQVAVEYLSYVELAMKQGGALPWTTGYATFISIMVRLVVSGQMSGYRMWSYQSAPDSGYLLRALHVLQRLGRSFDCICPYSDLVEHLHRSCAGKILVRPPILNTLNKSNIYKDNIAIPLRLTNRSEIFPLVIRALQSIKLPWI